MTTAITYQSGPRKSDLRTVVVDDVRRSVILLPTGSLDVVTAKLLEGTCSAADFWTEELGTDSDTFIVPAGQIRAQREMTIATIVRRKKGSQA